MKRIALICMVVVCAVPVLALAGDSMKSESGWFDFENCAFCKSLAEDPGLLKHTTWENYPIKNGSMTIMTVDPAYAESMAKVDAHMAALGAKIQNGEVNPMSLEMCGRCKSYGMLMMGGVDMERIDGEAARMAPNFNPGHLLARSDLNHVDIETAPIGDQQVAIIRGNGQVLGDRPDRNDLIDFQGVGRKPVHETLVPSGQSAAVPTRAIKPRPVHLIVGDETELTVAGEGRFHRRSPVFAFPAQARQVDGIGDGFLQFESAVVHGDCVPVHHVLREEETRSGMHDRLRGQLPGNGGHLL